MKIAYLHGLESVISEQDPKIIWLKKTFDKVYYPQIDYRDDKTYGKLFNDIKKMKPDLLVGSSMGGYFSYIIGSTLRIETCLFNPAVHSRSLDPYVEIEENRPGNTNNIYLGDKDRVITGGGVKRYFKEEGVGSFKYKLYRGGHRVPEDVFIGAIAEVLGIKEGKILTLNEFLNKK